MGLVDELWALSGCAHTGPTAVLPFGSLPGPSSGFVVKPLQAPMVGPTVGFTLAGPHESQESMLSGKAHNILRET